MDLSGDMMVIRGDGRTKTLQPHGRHTDLCGTLTQRFCCLNDSCSVSFWPLEIPSCSCSWGGKKRAGEAQTSKNVNECQISKFGPFLHPGIIYKTRAAKTLIRWEWERGTKHFCFLLFYVFSFFFIVLLLNSTFDLYSLSFSVTYFSMF